MKMKRVAQITYQVLIGKIVTELFPKVELINSVSQNQRIQEVTMDEIIKMCANMPIKYAPGMDCIPNAAYKATLKMRPKLFADIFSISLRYGVFPKEWKKQKLTQIPKLDKPIGKP